MNFQYDRYGNRTAQNVTQGSGTYPQPQLSFNSANNQVSGSSYDVAGNVISDGVHSYTYDAENNLTKIDGGSTASYQFDAMNERVVETTSAGTFHYSFDLSGRRSTQWDSTGSLLQAQYYGSAGRLAYWSSTDSNIHFEHADWEGTERQRTLPTAAVDGYYSSLPFGDGASSSGSDTNAGHFATLDQDVSSSSLGLSHATFREYHSTSGRWMSPDWYSGSYTAANPQSMDRYAYTLNTPSFFTDPSGLCVTNYTDTESYSGVGGTSSTTTSSEDDGSSACTSWQDFVGPGGGGDGGGGGSGGGGGAPNNAPTISQTACKAAYTAGGAAAGALAGGAAGGVVGGVAGGAGGTLVAPGVGTVGGGVAGAEGGATAGAWAGGALGGLLGNALGSIMCSSGTGGGGGGNPPDRCTQVRKQAISECTDIHIGAGPRFPFQDNSGPFYACIREKMEAAGCPN